MTTACTPRLANLQIARTDVNNTASVRYHTFRHNYNKLMLKTYLL